MSKREEILGSLVFSHHKWPTKSSRWFELIQSNLPRATQLVTARQ